MTTRLLALTLDADDPQQLAAFWSTLLGRDTASDPEDAVILPGSATQVGLRFATATSERVGPNRIHLHLTSDTSTAQDETVARALDLGGSHIDIGQLPEEGHVVLADPEGNEFCVIEAGNRFLAGCGYLGELACDGTRDVGLFWSRALDWPLVWDQDQETAVQSPDGGTKVAWGGPPLEEKRGRNRQRFTLVAEQELDAEVARLVELGATRIGDTGDGAVELTDPDGNEFTVRAG